MFRLDNDDFHRKEIITKRTIVENELAPLYITGNEINYGTKHGLIPEYNIFNNIFHNTLTPKRGDRTNIRGTTTNLLLAILDDQPPPCISTFFWTEMMYMLNYGSQYVIHAPYIQRIINFKTGMEFGYDGKHAAYQPHIVMASSSFSICCCYGSLCCCYGSICCSPCPPPPAAHVSPYAPETSRSTTHRDKHGNIFIKDLKTLISMCQSNDVVVHESHQQMSNMLSRMEERKHEMRTHLEP
jgi:hypothetical protein